MKAGWITTTLGDVCQIRPPKSEARLRLTDTDMVSFVPMEDLGIDRKFFLPTQTKPLTEVTGSYTYFADGDVLLAKITPCFENGKLGIAAELTNGIGFGSSEYIVFRPDKSISNEWLYYFLSRESFRTEGTKSMCGAVGHKRIAKEFIEECPIPVPPLPEQQRIVGILDEAFDGIAKAKANTEQALQKAHAIFESHLNDVFTQRGPGWMDKTVGEIAQHSLGKMLDKSKNKGEPQPYLRNINVRWFTFDLSDLLEMRFMKEESAKFTAVKGDVLICEGGYPGRAAIWRENYPIYFQKALHRVRFHEQDYNKWFVYFLYAKSKSGELQQFFTGAGIQHFTGEALRRFRLPIPPISTLHQLVLRIENLSAETSSLESIYQQKLTALDNLKKSLLHQAFNGELNHKLQELEVI